MLEVSKSCNGYYIRYNEEEYFLSIPVWLEDLKLTKWDADSERKEAELSQDILFEVFSKIMLIKHNAIWWNMCQLIESWGQSEKVENARKCMMWQNLEKHIN